VYLRHDIIHRVELNKRARKQLKTVPRHVIENLAAWVDDVEDRGLEEVRKIPGYHGPLHGSRLGQRSIRLSRAYRAVYRLCKEGGIEFVSVEEISKHAY